MAEEEVEEKKHKKSVRQYARKVLGESSVSAVSEIISTNSLPRKAFKLIIFLVFTSAFLYQVIKFLTYLYEYPTVVNIDLSNPDEYMAPAFTMCNSQIVRRSKYCAKYPNRCIPTDKEFCEEYSQYCRTSDVRVKKEFYWQATDHNDVLQMGYSLEDILQDTIASDEYKKLSFSNTSLLRVRHFNDTDLDVYSLCQAFNSIVQSPKNPILVKKSEFYDREVRGKVLSFILDPHEEDAFDPDILPGIYFTVHSPYDAVNPFQIGHYMLPGRKYKITIRLKEEQLLPYPYKTDCNDYIGMWNKNNRAGPRSKAMCKQKCIMDFMSNCINCTALVLSYPSDKEKICSKKDNAIDPDYLTKECMDQLNSVDSCMEACKEECLRKMFLANVREIHLPKNMELNSNSKRNPRPIYVDVDVDDDEILRYVFSPKYQET
nr:uncharacterized protein LOC107452670 [Parasteatoda tepidariorum]